MQRLSAACICSCRLPQCPDPTHMQTQNRCVLQHAASCAFTDHQADGTVIQDACQCVVAARRGRTAAEHRPSVRQQRPSQHFPDFVPAAQIAEIEELAALELASRLERLPVSVPSLGRPVETAFIAPASSSRIPAGVPLHQRVKTAERYTCYVSCCRLALTLSDTHTGAKQLLC